MPGAHPDAVRHLSRRRQHDGARRRRGVAGGAWPSQEAVTARPRLRLNWGLTGCAVLWAAIQHSIQAGFIPPRVRCTVEIRAASKRMKHWQSPAAGRAAAKSLLLAIASAIAVIGFVASSAASPRICRQLESQLAGLSVNTGDSGQARKYDRAIEAQQEQIDKAERQLRRAGCGGGLSIFGRSGGSACDAIEGAIDRMERNLMSLQRKRAQLGGGDSRRERARLLASIDANGCREAPSARQLPTEMATRDGRRSLFDQLFGGGVSRSQTLDDYERSERVRTILNPNGGADNGVDYSGFGGGAYRTLCVRTCDGYYFPISYSSSRRDFDRDQQNCETMCPGTDVRLFSHRVPDEESENMVAADGTAYTDLPTAFKYRDVNFSRPATCGCNPVKNFTIIGGDTAAAPEKPAAVEPLPVPLSRPDPAADPESLANRDGKFDAETIGRLLSSKPNAAGATAEKRVRVVGPAYLPDPEAALD
ncbi:MAG: DUF2865 domain-containing protein, partial [Mesorhizobium sp.]|nr:DUF2865 domain-containing protein [Mesorhizobium sp.]